MYTPPTNISLNEDNLQLESLTFEKTILEPGSITIDLVNGGPSTVSLSQIIINDSLWSGYISDSEKNLVLHELIPSMSAFPYPIPF